MKSVCLAAAIVSVVGASVVGASIIGTHACPAQDGGNDRVAGAGDKIFRVDRADLHECSELVTDRKELATLRHK